VTALRERAASTDASGAVDGWTPPLGFAAEVDERGATRLTVSAPPERLRDVHLALLGALEAPLSVLWRRVVDRRDPKPQGSPPADFVGVEIAHDRLLDALDPASGVVWEDARAECWVRGRRGDQVVLDGDGVMYAYPDDPAFRAALATAGVEERVGLATLGQRDYVRQWYHAEHDALEDALIAMLGLRATRR
jgi:hypothetical protein